MNKVCFSALVLCAGAAIADSGSSPTGTTLTTGHISNGHSLYAATLNPAVAALTVGPDESWRFAYLPSFSFSAEVGDVNNFVDDLDDLIDILDDPSLADDDIEGTLARFNGVLETMGKEGYSRIGSGFTAPLFPLYWRQDEFSGTFFAEFAADTQIRLSLLDEPLIYNNQTIGFTTGSSAYLKSGIEKRLSLGYARPLLNLQKSKSLGGQLYGGVKIKVMNLELSKQVMRLEQLEGRDIEDVIEDEYKNNRRSTTGIGIDLGVSWISGRYNAGLTLSNINSPSFDYGTIGIDCAQYVEGSFARNNCEAATYFTQDVGRISSREKHRKHAVATLDAGVTVMSGWTINGALDLARYDDMVGMETQHFVLSTAINTRSYWIPDVRLGYQKNLAGAKLASVGLGLSFFDVFTLDARMALDDVVVDGSKAPRSGAISLAFEEKF